MKKLIFKQKFSISLSFILFLYTKSFAENSSHGKPWDVSDDSGFTGIGIVIFIMVWLVGGYIHRKINQGKND
jgi:hypothetical protein